MCIRDRPIVAAPAPRPEAEAGEYDDIKLKALTELRPLIDLSLIHISEPTRPY